MAATIKKDLINFVTVKISGTYIMISRNRIRFIQSLRTAKTRSEEQLYIIEGDKLVKEYISAGKAIKILAGKPDFLNSLSEHQKLKIAEIESVNENELKRISTLATPHNVIAIISYSESSFDPVDLPGNLCVALDFVQDPGNMGTIIRASAWFGIKNIVCSENCVDVYNPKVVQASMGALLNVSISYCNLAEFLSVAGRKGVEVYGTLIDGESIYTANLERSGVIVLGNESKGISPELLPLISRKLAIPKFTDSTAGIESLNVGMAASIVFSEFARRSNS
jgi:TrmH family RNA methyltransferase